MLKYEFRCEICQAKFDSNYNIPKVLVCGHTVCSKCVDRMKEKDILRCPFDRKLIDYDEDKIAINYYILSLIDGSIKENPILAAEEVEEVFELTPKPVINNPGWKNTLDGFIKGDILYTIESNGFFYCTDLNTGEWWFLYLNQFWGRHYFQVPSTNKMFMIDHIGNLYQIFTKNYYIQIGKKNSWRNTTHLCILNDKLYTIETSNKLYETNLGTGKWKEIGAQKEKSEEDSESESSEPEQGNDSEGEHEVSREGSNNANPNQSSSNGFNFNFVGINITIPNILSFKSNAEQVDLKPQKAPPQEPTYTIKDAVMMVSTGLNILISNKKGELYLLNEVSGDTLLLNSTFSKNIEAYSNNSTHLYYFEKGDNKIFRTKLVKEEIQAIYKDFLCKLEPLDKSFDNANLIKTPSSISNSNVNFTNVFYNAYNSEKSENIKTPTNMNKEIYQKLEENKNKESARSSFDVDRKLSNLSQNELTTSNANVGVMSASTFTSSPSKLLLNSGQINKLLPETEKFIELGEGISPIKVIADEKRVVVTDKKGELIIFDIETQEKKNFQCLFMLRNCHLHNTILVGDGDLIILDPIRLSMNKLNILSGSEMIILHSLKFLSTIKHVFSCNSKIYFIDITGSLFQFLESEKKIAQIGNNGICRYLLDFAVHKNFLYTVENSTLYKTNLSDGNFIEVKNDYTSNYKYFFADNVHLVFVSKEDDIYLVKPEDTLKLKKKLHFNNIAKVDSIVYFKNHLVFYNSEKKSIESINLDVVKGSSSTEIIGINQDETGPWKVMIENFPDVSMFINNHDCLACITKDGVIYKLHC